MAENDEKTVDPLIKGRFAIYETPDGGYHLTYRPDGAEEDQHVQVPGMYVKLAMAKGGGQLKKLMKGLVG